MWPTSGDKEVKTRPLKKKELEDLRVKMTQALLYWIGKAAAATTPAALDEHICKHARELYTDISGDPALAAIDRACWSASMHNLLDIYDRHHGIKMTDKQQIARMQGKLESAGPRVEGETPVTPEAPVWELLQGPDPELVDGMRATADAEESYTSWTGS